MKWQMILPVVAMLCLAIAPQAALAHHHHCGYGGYGNNYGYGNSGYGGYGGNPWQQRMMGFQNRGYGGYGNGYGGGGGYGNNYGNYGGYGNSGLMNGFGRMMRGF